MNSRIQFTTPTRRLVIALMVLCFGLLPQAQAVSPPPDGGYPGNNTAEGTSALFSLTSGVANTALGFQALYYNTTSSYNTAEGFRALFSNTTGAQNTATGSSGLLSNTTGSFNTANGVNALYFNTTGTNNTASGARALFDNVGGIQNTAVGAQALYHNAGPGSNNTAVVLPRPTAIITATTLSTIPTRLLVRKRSRAEMAAPSTRPSVLLPWQE
jgi:hypothetical protein